MTKEEECVSEEMKNKKKDRKKVFVKEKGNNGGIKNKRLP